MDNYNWFYIMMTLILIIAVSTKFLAWWVKGLIVAYYLTVSYFFITVKNKIDKKYEEVLPVPDAYWDENSGWVETINMYIFAPLVVILIFIYFKWIMHTRTTWAKVLIGLSLIPATLLLIFFNFMFNFGYGYRP